MNEQRISVFYDLETFNTISRIKASKTDLQILADYFKFYKTTESLCTLNISIDDKNFGRDEPLLDPSRVRGILYKVHLKPLTPRKSIRKWNTMPFPQKRVSNRILIYAKGKTNPNAYLLLDILDPGHELMNNHEHLLELKSWADDFREDH